MPKFASWRFARQLALVPALAIALAAGCTANLDKNPTILKQAKVVQDLDDSVKAMDRRLSTVSADMQESSRDIARIKAAEGSVSPESVAALEQRVSTLESSLQVSTRTVAALQETIKNQDRSSARTVAAGAADRVKVTEAVQQARAAGAATRVHARGVTTSRLAQSSKPRGSYYLVKSGESMQDVATNNKMSVKSIADANRLPSSARLLAGQRLYVPGK